MPSGNIKIKPITFYGVRYVSYKACMAMNGIKNYGELQMHIKREQAGLPFVLNPNADVELSQSARYNRKKKFGEILKREGYWTGE